jgi:alanine racemase
VIHPATASAEIDLTALAANIRVIARTVHPAEVMVVVKADAYGHGLLPCARAARAAGAAWLGAATIGEGIALREAGDTGRVFSWLYGPGEDLAVPVAHDLDLGIHHPDQLRAVAAAANGAGRTARVHLKIDTALSRNGCPVQLWPQLCTNAAAAVAAGTIEVVGIWSHLVAADEPTHPATADQYAAFDAAVATARAAGLRPAYRHLANSAGALAHPDTRFELVRLGIAAYGIDPADGDLAAVAGITLQPVMTLRAQLAAVRCVPAGTGVSYGHTWTADRPTVLGLVPLGYADGVPRHASGVGECLVGGRRVPVRGRICMDQFVVDLGPDAVDRVGDEVVLFGSGDAPSASDWAQVAGTIGYEIVTRIGTRVPRVYREEG